MKNPLSTLQVLLSSVLSVASVRVLLLSAFLLLPSSFVRSADSYTANIYVTNTPAVDNTLTVNGDARTWKTNASLITHISLNPSGTNPDNATNLYLNIVGSQFTGPIYSSIANTNQVRLIGGAGQAMSISIAGGWGYYTITTNSATLAKGLRVPLSVETGAVRTNNASEIIAGVNAYATNYLDIARGGMGTNSTTLVGSWTNSGTFSSLGTPSAPFHVLRYADATNFSFVFRGSQSFNATNVFFNTNSFTSGIIVTNNWNSFLRQFYRANGTTAHDYGTAILYDNNVGAQESSVNYAERKLINAAGATVLNWSNNTYSSSWTFNTNVTVSGNFTVSVTNDARHYRVNGIAPFTGSVTNLGPELGVSNILVYSSGIVTNYYKIP